MKRAAGTIAILTISALGCSSQDRTPAQDPMPVDPVLASYLGEPGVEMAGTSAVSVNLDIASGAAMPSNAECPLRRCIRTFIRRGTIFDYSRHTKLRFTAGPLSIHAPLDKSISNLGVISLDPSPDRRVWAEQVGGPTHAGTYHAKYSLDSSHLVEYVYRVESPSDHFRIYRVVSHWLFLRPPARPNNSFKPKPLRGSA